MAAGSARPEPRRPRGWRRYGAALAGLAALTLWAHLVLLWRMDAWLDAGLQARTPPPRLQAAFVREILPAPAPVVAPAPPRPAAPPREATPPVAAPPASVASQPAGVEPQPDLQPESQAASQAASQAEPLASAASDPAAAHEAVASDGDVAASAATPDVEWPLGARLSYALTGWVRGEVHGSAQVEWLRDGTHYQVHLDVLVGPSFAPLMQRRMTSDGELGPLGLAPRRYDERTQIAFGSPRETTLLFEPGEPPDSAPGTVTLANGSRVAVPPGVQDTASQFVQLTYLFTIGASQLQSGHRIELPLALPKRVDRWIFEVMGEETLATPFGPVRAWHVKPQREGDASTLSVEAWFAPTLRYLPVRIVIHRGAEDHLDLLVDRLPQEAEVAPEDGPIDGSR